MKKTSLSLVVPAFLQEKTILSDIRSKLKVLQKTGLDYELIVVVDGAGDSTFKKLAKANLPKVRCLQYQLNQGKSYAIRFGMSLTKSEYVMYMDAGKEIDPQGILMLLEHMRWYDADVIVGSKRHSASQVEYSLVRKILSWGYYYLVKILFGLEITDTQAGIKLFRHKVIKKILPILLEKRFVGDLEMLLVARKCGFTKIYEAPIRLNYHLANVTSAATLKAIMQILLDTAKVFWRYYFS